tara:strand:+ start:1474 stop:1650 length:177 start_codon:yes stop_codon:yes gene_type:complete
MSALIFGVGLAIFITYMYFLVKMINTQHKIQEKELGKVQYKRKRVLKVNKKKSKVTNE